MSGGLRFRSKADLPDSMRKLLEAQDNAPFGRADAAARSGDGVDALRRALLAQIGWQGAGDGVFLARERHLDALRRARAFLDAAELDYAHSELFADHLRMAQLALAQHIGR